MFRTMVPTTESKIMCPIGKYRVKLPRLSTRSPGSRSTPKRPSKKSSPPSTSSTTAPPINNFPTPSSPTILFYARRVRCPHGGQALRSGGLFVVELSEEALNVEGPCHHCESAFGSARPLLLRTVPVQLDAVAVGIPQVQRLEDAVVRGSVDGVVGFQEPLESKGEVMSLGVEDGEVEEPCRMRRSRVGVAAHPGVQADVVVVSARGEEDCVVSVPLGHLESENVPVEAKGPLDVRHLQVNVADTCPRAYYPPGSLACLHFHSSSWISLPVILPLQPEGVYDQEVCRPRRPARTPRGNPPIFGWKHKPQANMLKVRAFRSEAC